MMLMLIDKVQNYSNFKGLVVEFKITCIFGFHLNKSASLLYDQCRLIVYFVKFSYFFMKTK